MNKKNYYILMLDCRVSSLKGSGALSGKMLLVRIVENNNFLLILGHVREVKVSFAS